MSGAALRTCRRIGATWGLSASELAALIDVVPEIDDQGFTASDEQLTRMSLVLGIWRELAEVYGPDDPRGHAYVRTEPELTTGQTVLQVMLSGLDGLLGVRKRLALMKEEWLALQVMRFGLQQPIDETSPW